MPDKEQRQEERKGEAAVGIGVGATGGGLTGAAIGSAVAGPVGTAIGAVIGAVGGGFAGKEIADAINPEAEDAYWREHHQEQMYTRSRPYEEYAPAYRTGYKGFDKHYQSAETFEAAEPELRRDYESTFVGESAQTEQTRATSGTTSSALSNPPPWEETREPARAAWTRAERGEAVRVPISEEQVSVGKREVEQGEVRVREEEVHVEHEGETRGSNP